VAGSLLPRAAEAAPPYSPWRTPTYADSTAGDRAEGEDPIVRQAAVEALGKYNGSIVAVDTATGRVLTIVNQKLALEGGFMPCSTVKITVALAALSEGAIDRTTKLNRTDMTDALAHSNNAYFAALGRKVGFEKVRYYAQMFGLGEKAGLDIEGEQPGTLPDEPPRRGGVGRMCSYGEGITLTPLELASLLTAIANGGTLYYLQRPRDEQEIRNFVPRVKRRLDIQQWIPEIKPGLMGAVAFGTARSAGFDPDAPILGKTGTCTDANTPTHLGWFGSFNEVERNQVVVVVMLTGGAPMGGGLASRIGGEVYRKLTEAGYFERVIRYSPAGLISIGSWVAP
jgi:cell division protein FtsI/penicillin-binding protein 2